MSNDYTQTLPPVPHLIGLLAQGQIERIEDYGHACAEEARAPLIARIAELERSFDEIAAAVGWTKERCDQDGDAPVDVADRLRADLAAKAGEVEALESLLDLHWKSMSEESRDKVRAKAGEYVNPLAAEVEALRAVLVRARRGLAWASQQRPELIEDYEAVDAAIAARKGEGSEG